MSSRDSNTKRTQIGSGRISGNDWESLDWNYTPDKTCRIEFADTTLGTKNGESCRNMALVEAYVHLAVLVEMNLQHLFLSAGKLSGDGGGVIRGIRVGNDLYAQFVLSGWDLHGMKFVTFHMVKNHHTFLVCAF
jgi:hypothetical protein